MFVYQAERVYKLLHTKKGTARKLWKNVKRRVKK